MPHSCPTCGRASCPTCGRDTCPQCGRRDAWDGACCNRCRTSSFGAAAPLVPIIDATLVDEAPAAPANRRRASADSAATAPPSSPRPRQAMDLPKHSNFNAGTILFGLLCFALLLAPVIGLSWYLTKRAGSELVGKWEGGSFDWPKSSLTYEFKSDGTGRMQEHDDEKFDWSVFSVDKKPVLRIDNTHHDRHREIKGHYYFTTQGNTLTLTPLGAPEKAMTFQKNW
jgi:hypothetical protein